MTEVEKLCERLELATGFISPDWHGDLREAAAMLRSLAAPDYSASYKAGYDDGFKTAEIQMSRGETDWDGTPPRTDIEIASLRAKEISK